jgi:PAS domain-containing protein
MSTERIDEARNLVEEARQVAMIPVLLRELFDTSAEAQVVIDSSGLIVLFNKKARLMFGWRETEVVGRPVEILLPEAKREIHVHHRANYALDRYDRAMGANLDLEACHRLEHNFPVTIDLHPLEPIDGEVYTRAAIRRKSSADDETPAAAPITASSCPFHQGSLEGEDE